MRLFKFAILLFIPSFVWAQSGQSGDALFEVKNYKDALKKYLIEYNKKKEDHELNRKIAECYLFSNIDKKKALPYLEFLAKQAKVEPQTWYDLGLAYHLNTQFEKAIEAYEKYKSKAHGKELEKVTRQIECCIYGKELIKNPLDVTFENLGKDVNTEYADYYPFIPADESYVSFTSRRKAPSARLEYDGLYSSDIYIAEVKSGVWQKAKSAGVSINTVDDEECVGLTHDGHSMLIYIDHQSAYGDIYISHKEPNKPFSKTAPFSANINSKYIETSASINMEENTVVFASDRPGGFGGLDIYISHILPDGTWGPPINLGGHINTKYDEDFPQLSDDGNELHFCSKGHQSMGGFDIFVSHWIKDKKDWDSPLNMGYPINTPDDDMHYAQSASGHEAYISAVRPEGFGDLDIYRIVLNKTEARVTALVGNVFYGDSLHPATDEFMVSIINKDTGEPLEGEFKYTPTKKKFVAALLPGHYILEFDIPGFDKLKEDVTIMDKSDFKPFIKKKFYIKKPGQSTPAPAKPGTPVKK